MIPTTPETLAQKWCPLHGWTVSSYVPPIGGPGCWCKAITTDVIAAVREALEEAQLCILELAMELDYWHRLQHTPGEGCEHPRGCGFQRVLNYPLAIAALREGRDA